MKKKLLNDSVALRTPLFHPDLPFIVHWSEKSGCTSVVKWFFSQINLLDAALAHHPWVHVYENEVFKVRKGYRKELVDALAREQLPSIKVIRDPYARCFSGYLELCRPQVLKQPRHWATHTRRRLIKGVTGDFIGLEQAFSFETYLDWLADQNPEELNPHITPQISRIDDLVPMTYFTINRFIQRIHRHPLGRALPPLPQESRVTESSHHHEKKAFSESQTLSILAAAFPLLRTAHFPIPEVSQATIAQSPIGEKIHSIFARDIEVFNQCRAEETEMDKVSVSA